MDWKAFQALCDVRVRCGISFCEATDPNWLPSINEESLDIRDRCGCVIGQRYGDYITGLCVLGVKVDPNSDISSDDDSFGWAVAHGFDLPDEFLEILVNERWKQGINLRHRNEASKILTDTWKRLIQERRDLLNLSAEPLSTETERCLATAG